MFLRLNNKCKECFLEFRIEFIEENHCHSKLLSYSIKHKFTHIIYPTKLAYKNIEVDT